MSNSKMLIDATHPEETRVVVVRGGRVEEFDYEFAARKLLRGNIYLAKVTRVEPSLQAAFVDYGGNRHGFLAFNEIHPDYYQIPVADRQALIEEEAKAEAEEEAEADAEADAQAEALARSGPDDGDAEAAAADTDPQRGWQGEDPEPIAPAGPTNGVPEDEPVRAVPLQTAEPDIERSESFSANGAAESYSSERSSEAAAAASSQGGDGEMQGGVQEVDAGGSNGEPEVVEEVQTEQDALEEVPSRPRRRMRSYKIQEVIKRRQVVLVQVVKEERGTKGAALTTYLSLAGRYTVLMPNTARGGGISRKITNPSDRKRLKAIANELEVPEGMGLIIRTAGAARTKQEIKRDFEYLLRLWESVRDLTLQSTAPSLVYEEGNLIKRSIRDHYTKDVDEVIVAGEHAHQEAHEFMRMLMPSHARNVINYRDPEPLFSRFQVERQLNAMFSPFVTLRSGGYLVINQTEALVAIDINSGKATREFSIEETALNTNLEASEEIARQLKLRDLAGLIVVDFIDMEEKRNNRAVERRLKDALRHDRARIQVGRISHFGLLEMSRQRLRTGVVEGSTSQCPHCQGTGTVRSTESVALAVLRGIEDALMASPRNGVVCTTTTAVALYILNNKRAFINDMEGRYGVPIAVQASEKLHGANFNVDRTAAVAQVQRRPERQVVNMDWGFEGESESETEVEAEAEEVETAPEDVGEVEEIVEASDGPNGESADENGRRGGRRRRRRRGRRGDRQQEIGADAAQHEPVPTNGAAMHAEEQDEPELVDRSAYARQAAAIAGGDEEVDMMPPVEAVDEVGGEDRQGRRGRRRGRRGGRRERERMPGFDSGASGEVAGPHGESAPTEGFNAKVVPIAGQGPQPDMPSELPNEFGSGEGRPMRRRERWRDRRWDGGERGQRRGEGQSEEGDAMAPTPAMIAASIAAASVAPPEPSPVADVVPASVVAPAPKPPAAPEPVAQSAELSEPAPGAEPEAPPPVAAAPAARARRSPSPIATEPVIERVVMRPGGPDVDDSGVTPPPLPKKGWWQRRFGGA